MRKSKRGTSTLFLAIILSALILVETTYIAFAADLDRRLTYTRALKEQTEIYLASYDRQLFKTYGIYATCLFFIFVFLLLLYILI